MATSGEGEAKTGKTSALLTVAIVAVLTLAAAGGGWLVGGLLNPVTDVAEDTQEEAQTEHAEEEAEETPAVSDVVALDPITTNLAYPGRNWIRLDLALVFKEAADAELARTIHQDILAYVRTVSIQQLDGARGFQHLRDDLTERVMLRSEGKVSDLIFKTFVIE